MISKGTLRRHERSEQAATVQVMWKDRSGGDKYANARALDVSESGMRIEVPEALQERSYVTLRADTLKLNGTASVRTCIRKGNRYWVGLEFSVGMKWKPPLAEAATVPQPS